MAENLHQKRASVAAGHELTDIDVRIVGLFAVGLVISAVIMHFALLGIKVFIEKQYSSPVLASRIATLRIMPPEPRLQLDPSADMDRFTASETADLNRYKWINRKAGFVQIPIDKAMDIIAQRGLPTEANIEKTPLEMRQEKAKEKKS